MKQLLVIKVPTVISGRGEGKSLRLDAIEKIRDRLKENYEVIITPYGALQDIEIQTSGMTTLQIDENTDFDKMFENLNKVGELKNTIREFKEIAEDHQDTEIHKYAQMIEVSTSNKNRRSCISDNVGIGEISSSDIVVAPVTLKDVESQMNIVAATTAVSLKPIKIRKPTPKLYDPFASCETSRINSDDFHIRFMPPGQWINRSYDGDPKIDPEECLDDYWIPIIHKVNKSDVPDVDILSLLKNRNIDPHFITSITTIEERSIEGDTKELSIDSKKEGDSTYVTLTYKDPMDGCKIKKSLY